MTRGIPNMRTALVTGGVPLPAIAHRMGRGAQLVFATPSRLAALLTRHEGCVSTDSLVGVVVDEAEELLAGVGSRGRRTAQCAGSLLAALGTRAQRVVVATAVTERLRRACLPLLRRPAVVQAGDESGVPPGLRLEVGAPSLPPVAGHPVDR